MEVLPRRGNPGVGPGEGTSVLPRRGNLSVGPGEDGAGVWSSGATINKQGGGSGGAEWG